MKFLKTIALAIVGRILTIPPNRVVTALAPPLAIVAGYVAAWVPEHLPGLAYQPSQASVAAFFVAGAATVVALAWKWMTGWQAYETALQWEESNARLHSPTPPPADDDPVPAVARAELPDDADLSGGGRAHLMPLDPAAQVDPGDEFPSMARPSDGG